MYMYQYHNTKHMRVTLGTTDMNAYCQGTDLSECFAGWQVRSFHTCWPAKQQNCWNIVFHIF